MTPRAVERFPAKQRLLARELIGMAAYSDSRHRQFGIELKRGQVATTYRHLAERLGWETPKAVRYQLGELGQTWGQAFGQTLGQTRNGNLLIITLGGYNDLQQFETYANDAKGRPEGRPEGRPGGNNRTEVNRTEFNRTEREEEEAAGPPALSLSQILERPETEDPAQFRREAEALYDATVAAGHIDANKRPFRMKDKPDEFSPLMNVPHGLRLELLGLLLTVNTYYGGKDVNLGQLRHFVEGGDLFMADTGLGFERAGLRDLLPQGPPKKTAARQQVAPIDEYRDTRERGRAEFTRASELADFAGKMKELIDRCRERPTDAAL